MSRKIKKDKVIAKLRRQLKQGKAGNNELQVGSNEPKPSSSHQSPITYPISLIKKDLTKIISLAILAISLELGIYYLSKLKFLPF